MKKDIRFHFVAYLSPPPAKVGYGEFAENANFIDEENYRTMTECGFDRAIGLFENRTAHYLAGMRQAEKAGMEYFVRDQFKSGSLEGFIDHPFRRNPRISAALEAKIAKRFDRYADMPAFSGILASDEPPASKFPAIRAAQDWFFERYPGKKFIVNLLPTYANAEQLSGMKGAKEFNFEKEYVGAFIDTVRPEVLSYDHYALIYDAKNKKNVLREDYLRNLEVFATYYEKKKIPFYNFLLTLGHLFYRTVKTYADIAWQVYTSMAYGVRGIQTFTYWTVLSNGPGENITSGLVDREGRKMPAWYAMQKVIGEVRSFEELYMRFCWQGTVPVRGGETENPAFSMLEHPLSGDAGISEIRASEDCIVGVFGNQGERAYLVSNYTDPAEGKNAAFSARFRSEKVVLCRGGARKEISLQDDVFECTLESGEGIFLIPKE